MKVVRVGVLALCWLVLGLQGCSDDPVFVPSIDVEDASTSSNNGSGDAGSSDTASTQAEDSSPHTDTDEATDAETSDASDPADSSVTPDATLADAEVSDTDEAMDSGEADTGDADTVEAMDSAPADTELEDTELEDTGLEDTSPTDTELEDTAGEDVAADVPSDVEDASADVEDASSDADASMDAADASPDVEDASPDAQDTGTDEDTGEPDTSEPPPVERTCNFLINANAESNDLSGWTVEEGEFRTVEGSGLAGLPDAFEGTWSFAAGRVARAVMSQTEDVSAWADAIDAGGIYARFSGQVRNWSGDDEARLAITALDGDGGDLASILAGPWLSDAWTWRVVEIELPPLTRAVRVTLRGDRNRGTDNDAYFDALELCLDPEPAPPSLDDLSAPPYLMWSDQGGVSVRWETTEPRIGRVEYGPTEELGMTVTEESPRQVHELRLTGLEPGTLNHYRISWGGSPLPTQTFHTAPDLEDDRPFTFVVWGDNQNGPENFREIVPLMDAEGPQFAVSTGDCVQNGTRGEYREQLFEPLGSMADHVPFLIGAGNHERYSDGGATLFDEYMSQPGDEHCFGWRWGPIYFMFIDTELAIDPDSPQGQCIGAALSSEEATSASFRAAVFHKPPRIEWWFGGRLAFIEEMEAPWVREELEPYLESLDVDVVFNGHNHLYAYTPETDGGITWVTTGGAGGFIDTDNFLWRVGDWPEIAVTRHEHHFLSVRVEGDAMTVTAINIDGQQIDQFTVTADP